MTSSAPDRILVVRNDKLGDFMLSYPAFALLKRSLPQAQVLAVVAPYTREMAEVCPWIDGVLSDPAEGGSGGLSETRALLRGAGAGAIISLFSTARIGAAAFAARIPERVAPATKLAQVFYNARLRQRRSRSEKPESEYNADLVRFFLARHGITPAAPPAPPLLSFDRAAVAALRTAFVERHGLPRTSRLVFLHAGSGGSARNLSLEQFGALAAALRSREGHAIVLTAGPGEKARADALSAILTARGVDNRVYLSSDGLAHFARHIQFADLFISGSTGPLHIAGALDVPTAAFYPRRRSATALRWRTLNAPARRLAFAPPPDAEEEEMQRIDVQAAAAAINARFL